MKDKTVIIDGNSLTFRAFYALPGLKTKDGKPCNAIYGFVKMLINIIQKVQPNYIAIAFDAGKHTFRHNLFEAYKGTRSPTPEELKAQFEPLKELIAEMGIKILEQPEIEADDLIGSLAKKVDGEVVLVSGDKDLLQLVNERTTVSLTMKGISEILEVDIPTLKEKFGIEPYQVVEMKSIRGDTSDNIPGVRGIGDKTALKLIQEYGSLDGIYQNINNIKGKVHDQLVEQKEMAELSRTLATIKTDVEINLEKDDLTFDFPFNNNVFNIMDNLGFKSILTKEEYFVSREKISLKQVEYESVVIEEIGSFENLCSKIKDCGEFALNVDNQGMHFSVNKTEYVLDNLLVNNMLFYDLLGQLLQDESILKVLFDVKVLKHYFKLLGYDINNYFDVSLAVYLTNESEGLSDLVKVLEQRGLDVKFSASNLMELKDSLTQELKNRNQWQLFNEVELKLVEVLFQMELQGIKVDKQEIKNLSAKYTEELNELVKKIIEIVGYEFNLNSPKQLQQVLFEDLKLVYKGKKSTSVDVLEAIESQHEIVPLVLRYRKINKLVSTYLDGMLPYVKSGDKIHTTFLQNFTSTGRLSSREPNLQNIPVRDDESKELRKLFVSSFENGCIVTADYNQIELRLMAIMSGDSNLINDFKHKIDVHSMTASKIFGVKPEDVTSLQRRTAKAVNFGIIYGISEFGLAKNINCSVKEAKEFIAKYFELYPQIKEYMNSSIEYAKENGYTKSYFNRIRHIPELKSDNHMVRMFGERIALNMPLQGTASDIIKMAMIKVYNSLIEKGLKSKLVLQIHDELLVDVCEGEEEIVKEILEKEMTSVTNFVLPLDVSISSGKTWFEAK